MKSMKFYPRTYRYLENNFLKSAIYYIGIFLVPLFFGLIMHMEKLTNMFSHAACEILRGALPGRIFQVAGTSFWTGKTVCYVKMTEEMPMPLHLDMQILIAALIFLFTVTGKRAGRPFFLFLAFEDLGFMINGVFFRFWASDFPYSVNDFSELYIRQQMWILIAFIVLFGIGTSCLGNRKYGFRLFVTLLFALYTVLFAFVRYVVFLYVLSKHSMLYMFTMYFTFGPLFDCLNMVTCYGLMMNGIIKSLSGDESGKVWLWS